MSVLTRCDHCGQEGSRNTIWPYRVEQDEMVPGDSIRTTHFCSLACLIAWARAHG